MSGRWKTLAANASRSHRVNGYCIAPFSPSTPNPDLTPVNVVAEELLWTRRGQLLNPVDIRRYFWERRNHFALRRSTGLLWTVYNPTEDTSYMGLGLFVKPETARRFDPSIALVVTPLGAPHG